MTKVVLYDKRSLCYDSLMFYRFIFSILMLTPTKQTERPQTTSLLLFLSAFYL